jgi:hypothetical protein
MIFLAEDCAEESSDPVEHAMVLGLRLLSGRRSGRRLHLRLQPDWLGFRGRYWQRRSLVHWCRCRTFLAFENEWRIDLNVNLTWLRRRQGAGFGSVR